MWGVQRLDAAEALTAAKVGFGQARAQLIAAGGLAAVVYTGSVRV